MEDGSDEGQYGAVRVTSKLTDTIRGLINICSPVVMVEARFRRQTSGLGSLFTVDATVEALKSFSTIMKVMSWRKSTC